MAHCLLPVRAGLRALAPSSSVPLLLLGLLAGCVADSALSPAEPALLNKGGPLAKFGITSLAPDTATRGRVALTLTVDGNGFVSNSVVQWNGTDRPTTYVNAQRLTAAIPASDLAVAGTAAVTVVNPAKKPTASQPATFTVYNPRAEIAYLSSAGATAGSGGFTLVVRGTGFLESAVVRWNGVSRPTRFVDGTRVEVTLGAQDLATPGVQTLAVANPEPTSGPASAVPFTVRAAPSASLTSLIAVDLAARDVAYSSRTGRLYASVSDGASPFAGHVVALDPATGAVVASLAVGSAPSVLAVSAEGEYLYVGLDGENAVRRIDLRTFGADLRFPLGAGLIVDDMEVMPGAPRSVAISRRNLGSSPRHEGVAIFDDGVQRPTTTPRHTGSNVIEFSHSGATLYGYNNETTEFGFRTMAVGPAGVSVTNTTSGLISRFYADIAYAGGRVYSSHGEVIDPELRQAVGALPASGAVRPDVETGRAFFLAAGDGLLRATDINTLQSLGSVAVPGLSFEHPTVRSKLIRWGSDGLAFRNGGRVLILRTPLAQR